MRLSRLFQTTTSAIASISPGEWDALVEDAAAELLLPALRGSLSTALGVQFQPPPEIEHVLTTAESLNRERNQFFIQEAIHVAKLLNSIGIRPVALKGLAYLLAGIYPDPAGRYLLDIDFLIPKNSLPVATSLLEQHGFIADTTDAVAPLRHHAPSLARPNGPPVELHHQVALGVGARLLPASELLSTATLLEREGAFLLVPSATQMISHLIVHSQLHNAYRYRALPPLRALHDLALLANNQPVDWPYLINRYRERGEYLTLALHLKEAHRQLGLAVPVPLKLGLVGNLRWLRRRTISRLPWLRFLDPVHILMATFRNRLRMLRHMIASPHLATAAARSLIRQCF